MTTEQAIKLVLGAKAATQIFTNDDIDKRYKELVTVLHPDKVGLRLRKKANDAFVRLGEFRDRAKGKTPSFQPVKIGNWVITEPHAHGDIADIYRAKKDDLSAIFKIARLPKDNDLMDAERDHVKALRDKNLIPKVWSESWLRYVPEVVDAFKASDRRVNVLSYYDHAPELILLNIQSGATTIDFRHVVWMMNRLLSALGYAHNACGIVHGAVVPEHLLYGIKDHGLSLLDWCYSVKIGEPIKAVVGARKLTHYPKEVLLKKPATPATDIYMAAKCLQRIGLVPKRFKPIFDWMLAESPNARPQDAWKLLDQWMGVAKLEYGEPKYVSLDIAV